MPNWVFNTMKFYEGYEDFKKKYVEIVSDDKGNKKEVFDYNKVIQRPKSLELTDGTITAHSVVYYLTDRLTKYYINEQDMPIYQRATYSNITQLGEWISRVKSALEDKNFNYTADKLYELGEIYVNNFRQYGALTWYDWSNRNWGVKWNACDTVFDDKNSTVHFDSPWTYPYPVLDKLAEENKSYNVDVYSEEETGWWVSQRIMDGKHYDPVDDGELEWDDENDTYKESTGEECLIFTNKN